MKKSFTLIELMVTLIISMILINFTFSYQLNFFKELKHLEAKENLAMESFKLSEIITRGLKYNSYEIPGLVNASYVLGNNKFVRNGDISSPKWQLSLNGNFQKFDNYINKRINTNTNANINKVKDLNANTKGLISLKLNLEMPIKSYDNIISNPKYDNYTRLVYTR